jgi:aryl-alcohol dehydrogenase-like predicted oxidoreductase
MGGWMWGGIDEGEAVRAIHASLDAGINLIDTAPAYGLGFSETLVGKAIAGRRQQAVIATKCGLVWHTRQGNFFFEEMGKPVHRFLGADSLRHEVEQSLRRLQTDHIDLYQTHWQDPSTPIEETMGTLLALKQEGKIRAIGVSNAPVADMQEYQKVGPLDTDQEKYSMLDRGPEAELLPFLRQHNIAFLAYSPLALGLLTGKIGPERQFRGDDLRQNNPRFRASARAEVQKMLKEIEPIARNHDLTMTQLVLTWTLTVPGMTHVLVGARNREQVKENIGAGAVELWPDEVKAITDAAERYGSNL